MMLSRRTLLTAAALTPGAALLTRSPLAADRPKSLVVSYVTAPFNVPAIIVRRRNLLEAQFAPLGITVEHPEITAGPKQTQALAAGALHIASVLGGTSAILARANGVDLTVIGAFSRSPRAFTIMGLANGPANIPALKGKKIAGPKGTTLHQLLVAALTAQGLKPSDVEHVNMDLPQARAALLSGAVDAATLAGNHVLVLEAAGGRVIQDGQGLIDPTTVIAARRDFVEQQGELVERYRTAHRQALAVLRDTPDQALALAAEEQKVTVADAARMLGWYDFSPRMTERDIANMAADQDFMLANGLLEKRIDVGRDLIHPSALTLA